VVIKFDILNRFTNTIQFTAEIDCEEGELNSVKLGLSIKRALENDANLSYANLSDAYLSGANLSGANLRGTNLSDANLSDANLRGAYLIHLGVRSDGYEFFAVVNDGVIWIKAGCRYFSIKDAANHWKETRDGTPLGDESKQFLSHARKLVKIRNLLEMELQEMVSTVTCPECDGDGRIEECDVCYGRGEIELEDEDE
jgi:hypothetical protein